MSSSSSSSPPITQSIAGFCSVYRDETKVVSKCKTQLDDLKKQETALKAQLRQYLTDANVTCIPLKLKMGEEDEKMVYLRLMDKKSCKSVTDDIIKSVIEKVPTTEELVQIYHQMDRNSSLMEVYVQWVYDSLEKQTAVHRTVFELSTTKQKKRKMDDKDNSKIPIVPAEVMDMTAELFKTQLNQKRIRSFKKEKVVKFQVEREKYLPKLDEFLASKPPAHQEQKISLNLTGEPRPYQLKRVLTKRVPSLTLNKSKPLVSNAIVKVMENEFPEIVDDPFHPDKIRVIFEHQTFQNLLFDQIRNEFEMYRKNYTTSKTSIVLREEHDRRKPRKQTKTSTNEHDNGGENDNEQEEEEDDEEEEEDDNENTI